MIASQTSELSLYIVTYTLYIVRHSKPQQWPLLCGPFEALLGLVCYDLCYGQGGGSCRGGGIPHVKHVGSQLALPMVKYEVIY